MNQNLEDKKKSIINKIRKIISDSFIVVSITAIYNRINTLRGKFKLYRHNDIDKLGNVVVLKSPEVFVKKINPTDIKKQKVEYQIEIDKFIKKMEEELDEESLILMHNNLTNLKIRTADFYLILMTFLMHLKHKTKGDVVGGGYIPHSNSMIIYSEFGEKCSNFLFKHNRRIGTIGSIIFRHELLHMSSSIKRKNKSSTGFSQHYYIFPYPSSYDFVIGNGINEGYTEVLNQRIFGSNIDGPYAVYREIAKIIEDVVGANKMTSLYFNGDLAGLIKELGKYISEQDTKKFILLLDSISVKNLEYILDYLKKVVRGKIDYDLNNKLIDENTAIERDLNLIKRIEEIHELILSKMLHIDTDDLKENNSLSR